MTTCDQRCYLVVVDATPESRLALRYAARRAQQTGGRLLLLHVVPPTDFVQWGGVQDAIEAEALAKAETLLGEIVAHVRATAEIEPETDIAFGPPVEAVRAAISAERAVSALVLGAAAKGAPGPLVAHFAGEGAGQLPCPVVIVPGGMTEEALDRVA